MKLLDLSIDGKEREKAVREVDNLSTSGILCLFGHLWKEVRVRWPRGGCDHDHVAFLVKG